MSVYYPDGVDAQGNEAVIFVPTIADLDAPTVAELTGASAVNLSCALRGFSPGGDQGSSDDTRLCSVQQFESPGRFAPSIDDWNYVYDPQAEEDTPENKHYEVLKGGVKGFVVDRRGIASGMDGVPVAADQKVDIYPVTLGEQRRAAIDPSAEGGKFEITQKPFVTGPVRYDVEVAAGA